jgi:uncharacterized protein YecE (DUF72 family)
MKVWIGTSGYSYPDWVGPFYPEGTRPNKMLAYYSREFPLVELNFTFYRPPTGDMLARIADQTPPGFQFLVKLPRTLSHEENPADLPGFRHAVEQLRARGKLLGLLCQLPQATHYTRRDLAWLERLGGELLGLGLAVEFRHRSWNRQDVADWLGKLQIDLVSVDAPDLPALFPRGLVRSTPNLYVRWHSRNADNWYAGDKDRYDYHYSDAELGEWIDDLAAAAPSAGRAVLLFNNCHRSQAVDNARRMRTLIGQSVPGLDVVQPTGTAEPVQRSLFD